jgi:hypothetical protein
VIMKRIAVGVAIIVGLLIAIGIPVVRKQKQESASLAMMVVTADLKKHVQIKSQWPRSWEELYPNDLTRREYSRVVRVNWQLTVEEITDFMDRIDASQRKELLPPDVELPVLVGFTDRVPRDKNLARSERFWNWMTARAIYMERNVKDDQPTSAPENAQTPP